MSVLRGVTLALYPAQVVAVLGPSGSGKSTLMHLLGGLERPDAGEIFWAGRPIGRESLATLAKLRTSFIGLVFQRHYLLEDLTVLENVTLPGRISGLRDKGRGLKLLAQVGLTERWDFYPKQLSGGEMQRVAVARALYMRPKVILADEPTGSLDRHNAISVYHLLVELAREEGSAVLLVTHDEGLVQDVNRRYHLQDGVLVEDRAVVH